MRFTNITNYSFYVLKGGISMEESINLRIRNIKINHNKRDMEEILNKMRPLILKYARKIYFMEKEDSIQELSLSIIEAIDKINTYDNEAMCIKYLQNSVFHKYCYLCKKSITASVIDYLKDDYLDTIPFHESYDYIELRKDMDELLKSKNDTFKQIVRYKITDDLSDLEISKKMNVSRQYVNRVRNTLIREISKTNQ